MKVLDAKGLKCPMPLIETKKETQIPDEPPCQRDLSIGAYKIWLTNYYNIKKM